MGEKNDIIPMGIWVVEGCESRVWDGDLLGMKIPRSGKCMEMGRADGWLWKTMVGNGLRWMKSRDFGRRRME